MIFLYGCLAFILFFCIFFFKIMFWLIYKWKRKNEWNLHRPQSRRLQYNKYLILPGNLDVSPEQLPRVPDDLWEPAGKRLPRVPAVRRAHGRQVEAVRSDEPHPWRIQGWVFGILYMLYIILWKWVPILSQYHRYNPNSF